MVPVPFFIMCLFAMVSADMLCRKTLLKRAGSELSEIQEIKLYGLNWARGETLNLEFRGFKKGTLRDTIQTSAKSRHPC